MLDGDDAGRARQNALVKSTYATHDPGILMLDDALGRPGEEVEIEDLLGEAVILGALREECGHKLVIDEADRCAGSLPRQIKAAASRLDIDLPKDWKVKVARHLVSAWVEGTGSVPEDVLDSAGRLFATITQSVEEME